MVAMASQNIVVKEDENEVRMVAIDVEITSRDCHRGACNIPGTVYAARYLLVTRSSSSFRLSII